MNNDEFEKRMRALEYFHALRLPQGAWTVLRVDGRSFTRFTETGFEKPIDSHFQQMMRQTARALLEELHGAYAYTESDEISVLFDPDWDLFDRELEKLVSISAAIASATLRMRARGLYTSIVGSGWESIHRRLSITSVGGRLMPSGAR